MEELDGTKLARRVAATQIKKFYPRGEKMTRSEQQEEDEIPTEPQEDISLISEQESDSSSE